MAFGCSTRRQSDQSPLEVKIDCPVVVALNEFDQPEWKSTWQSGVLVLTHEGVRVRIDEDTGQLLDAHFGTENDRQMRVQVGDGLFDQEYVRSGRALQDVPNAFDRQAPWNSFCRYLVSASVDAAKSLQALVPGVAGEAEHNTADRALAFVNHPQLMELVTQSVSALFSDRAPDFLAASDAELVFWIPRERSLLAKHPFAAWAPATMIGVDELAGQDSWVWRLGRQAALIQLGENDAAKKDFWTLLSSPKTGPLACWTNSCALAWVAPNWQKLAADIGARRLNRSLFQHDLEGLLRQGGNLQRMSERLARQLRTFSDDDLASAIPILLDEDLAALLNRQWLRWIRDEELSDEDLLPMLLGSLWKPLFRDKLTERLSARQNLDGDSLSPEMVHYLDHVEGRSTNQFNTSEVHKGSLLFPNVPPAVSPDKAKKSD